MHRAGSAVSTLLRGINRSLKLPYMESSGGIPQVLESQDSEKSQQVRSLSEEPLNKVRSLKPGDKLHGYTVQRVEDVPEFAITTAFLTHDKTGAEHLHAARDDSNNAFSVLFRTTPMDSSGIPHILEHTVLCGSEQFPVRDPFFKMLSRSMSTFMNAMTAYDWTMYPFSSQNEQDYKNLMSVYMDAAFSPLIRELDFCQEGWRLEHTEAADPESPIIFKGVVYNEMKGVFSNPQSTYQQAALNSLLPSHTYGVVSGGDPAHIPELTYQQLKDFHATYYHPSNSKFVTYGNLPLENHLEFINSKLEKFDKITVTTQVPLEKRWSEPRTKHISCPPDPMAADPEKQTTVSINYLLSDVTDVYDSFINNIVCYLLTNGETSPFYRSLLETNIGSDFAPNTAFSGDQRESTFSVGLQNIKKDDVQKVVQIIEDTIDKVVNEGFEKTNIDALLHTIELGNKHETKNFGMNLCMGLAGVWTHDGDPVEQMQNGKLVERFRAELETDPEMLKAKVKKHLKDNPHRLTLVMSPDPEVSERLNQEEQGRLEALVGQLTDADRKTILERGIELQKMQMGTEDLSCLPSLKVDDLSRKFQEENVEITQADWSFIQTSEQQTNDVAYLHMASNLYGLSEDLLPYVPLFCEVITKIGAGGHDFLWMSQQQDLLTGGMSAAPTIVPHHTNPGLVQASVLFNSYCLEKNFVKMLDLWAMIINSPDFDNMDRMTTLIKMSAANLASSLSGSGHMYAVLASARTLNTSNHMKEMFGGYEQVKTMKSIAELSDLSDVIHKMRDIGNLVLDKTSIRLSINTTPKTMDRSVKNIKNFLGRIKGEVDMAPIFPELDVMKMVEHKTQYELPFNVNYCAESFPAVNYNHKDYTSLQVLGTLMSRKFLHREIREKGGAYGSGASMADGTFSFFSYRDPRSLETMDVFSDAVSWASSGDFTDQDVDEAKLGMFQQLDQPVPPGQRGFVRFLKDVNNDMRQSNRDRLFAVRKSDLERVSDKYLKSKPSCKAFLGPANPKISEEEGWSIVKEETERGETEV